MTDAERTYTNLMIFKTMASTKGRISVKQIHAAIEPNMGISIRSLQRYLNGLVHWGLVAKDGETPQGFTLTDHAKQLFAELASGTDA
ncbi:hypothetical protein GCM10023345_15140 [Acinetobacter kookii]|uniref:Transcriptional regulator n=1 Tax=Acinetobacter kookii TaxID=1226327 RepID=A0A1G6GMW7_9GAMM|nr:hypothetical protein [Acinetobacter kookii]SDB83332.1 hypothetical protein SAMN05421732_101128 [Acinetobacter kookii]